MIESKIILIWLSFKQSLKCSIIGQTFSLPFQYIDDFVSKQTRNGKLRIKCSMTIIMAPEHKNKSMKKG